MKELLYWAVGIVAEIHNRIMQLNNAYEMNFTDKELHFLVIGLLGMGLVFLIYPVFRYMARHGGEMTITWIYVFTVILVITFAIEIGQKITNTGNMEFMDIMYGVVGFLVMFVAFEVIRTVIRWLIRWIRKK